MIRKTLLPILLASSLAAQTTMFTTLNPAAARPKTLKEYLQKNSNPDLFILLEEDKESTDAFQTLTAEEPILEWGLTLRRLGPDDPVQKELRSREGWSKGPHWALLDRRGAVRAHGTAPTTAAKLAEGLRDGGYRPSYEILQEFLRKHPDRGDAWADLFNAQRARANRLMQPLLKPPADGKPVGTGPVGAAELIRPLTDAEDERIFAPVVNSLRGLLGVEGWGEAVSTWMIYQGSTEMHSQRLRDEARIQLPRIEALLRSRPDHWIAWMFWSFLFPLTDREPTALLEDLVPVPGKQGDAPPTMVLDRLIRQLRSLERWSSLKALVAPAWDRFRQETRLLEMKGQVQVFNWGGIFAPLLEAHLRLGDRARADELVTQAAEWSPPRTAFQQFSKIARDCHEEELALRWERLAPAAVKAP